MIKAGLGATSITPQPPVYLAGFSARTEPATSVHEPLEARVLFLSDEETTLCLVVCDLLGMTNHYSRPIREAIATRLGTSVGSVLVSCTHTHSGPSVIGGTEALGWPTPSGYGDLLLESCVEAAAAASITAQEAKLRYVRAPLPDGVAFNRRKLPYEDPWFSALEIVGASGRLGVLANLGIHPVMLGPGWLAVAPDWVGPFRTALEGMAGGMAIQLTGALGDVNPTPPSGEPDDSYQPWAPAEQTHSYAETLASAVHAALSEAEDLDDVLAIVRSDVVEFPVGGTDIAALHRFPTLRVDLIEWSVGGVRLVSIPGEAFHELGREISSARGGRVLLAGIAPSWHGYLPHPWGDGYEEGVSYGEEFVRSVRDALITAP